MIFRVKFFSALLVLLFALSGCSDSTIRFSSPDKDLMVTFRIDTKGVPYYSLTYKNELLIDESRLGLHLQEVPMDTALTLLSHTVEMNRYADAPIGIPADSSGIYNELIAKVSRENKEMDIVIRLYDDGVAIRYWLRGYENVILEGDMTEINLTNDGTAYWSVGDYNSGEKLNYYRGDITRIAESGYDTLLNKADRRFKDNIYVNTPFLMKTQSGKYLNLQQVGCTGYDYYKLRVIPGERTLYSSIYVDGLNQKVITLPYNTQWQTIGVAESASDLLASDLVYNLSVEEDEEKEKYTHPISRYNNFCYNNVILPFSRHYEGNREYVLLDITEKSASTIAHQMGLHIVFNRPLSVYSDYTGTISESHPISEFVRQLPAEWGETRIIGGELGKYVIVARKDLNSDNWFVGGIGDGDIYDVDVSFDFLASDLLYRANIYEDGKKADWLRNPGDYVQQQIFVRKDNTMSFHIAPGGGFAIILKKVKNS